RDVVGGVNQLREYVARAGTRDRILRPLLGDGCKLDARLRPQHLAPELKMLKHLGRIRRGGGDDVVRGPKPCSGAIVEHKTILAQHQAIARLALRKRRKLVDIDAVKEGSGIGSLNVDLTEGRHI